jgi:hypothetical protein
MLLVAALVTPAARAQEADAPFAPVVGGWGRHGFGVTVYDDGTAEASWRIYRWCGPGVPRPCDELTGNRIIDGGYADLTFTEIDENGAVHGEVSATSDTELLAPGPITLIPQDFGLALLEQGDIQLILCGPRYIELAPPEIVAEYPCGA